MLAVVLSVLGLAGGVAITYFAMDAPRRRAAELRRRLDDELDRARRAHDDNEDRASRLAARTADLRDAQAALDRRVAEFDRRAITYDDLAAENRLVKQDLRNMALVVGQAEARADQVGGLIHQRDLLGQAYLEEVRAAARKALTPSNYAVTKRRLEAALARLEEAGVRPTAAGRDQLFGELQTQYELTVRAEIEREEQARLRERMRERIRDEQRREREVRQAQEAAEQAERERQAIERALQLALGRAAGAHAAEVDQLRAQLAEAEAKAAAARTISLAEITKSGFVYVIANLGSFGPDVFKIGLTRRVEWQERVVELSGAAVPFPFEVYLVLTSDDAPALEATLHRAFRHRRVNRANPRKEFFRARIEEVLQVVERLQARVEYRADPEALEYLRSQSMTDAEAAEVEAIVERAEQAERAAGVLVAED